MQCAYEVHPRGSSDRDSSPMIFLRCGLLAPGRAEIGSWAMGKGSGEAPEGPWSSVLRVLLLDLFSSLTLQQMPRDYTSLHSWRY